jgi:hypothetical protein
MNDLIPCKELSVFYPYGYKLQTGGKGRKNIGLKQFISLD